ncbi:MAG TPA: transcription antitermination factor NusB [Gammaproteobacteria bacterium]|nr:transcription antitermination factor NusB [Gammaproteobacteria bacterium]
MAAKEHPAAVLRARSRARRVAMQALYQWQMTLDTPGDLIRQFADGEELAGADRGYFDELVIQCVTRCGELEAALAPCLDRPLAQLDPVERAILLVGAYELLFKPEVPYRVAINEGVELARSFGAEEGYKYVNAVLDRLAARTRTIEYRGAAGDR